MFVFRLEDIKHFCRLRAEISWRRRNRRCRRGQSSHLLGLKKEPCVFRHKFKGLSLCFFLCCPVVELGNRYLRGNSYFKANHAEFQRMARGDEKAFLSDQCKEVEENNRMGKTRDLFKKIRDTKGTFHAEMGSIKDRNVRDLTEAEDIKKRWQEIYRRTVQKRSSQPR